MKWLRENYSFDFDQIWTKHNYKACIDALWRALENRCIDILPLQMALNEINFLTEKLDRKVKYINWSALNNKVGTKAYASL